MIAFPNGVLRYVMEFYATLPVVLWDSPNPTIHIRGLDVLIGIPTENEVLGVPHISNVEYLAKDREMNMIWLCETLFWGEFRKKAYCPSTKGITSA